MSKRPILDLVPLPEIDLRHILVMTDETGMLQHAVFATPDLDYGYCTDDNARALIATVMAGELQPRLWEPGGAALLGRYDDLMVPLRRYLAFLNHAFDREVGRFRNFMSFDRRWLEEVGSEDSHARAVWALGTAARLAPNEDVRRLAERLLSDALAALERLDNLRPLSFGLLGLDEYLKSAPDSERASSLRLALATRLFDVLRKSATRDWPWWEDRLTWGNAKLPHALLVSGSGLNRQDMVEKALAALRWLLEVQTAEEGNLSVVGNDGWFVRGGVRSQFDQQPIEAQGLTQACVAAAAITGDKYWIDEAKRSFGWFTGHNDLGIPLYNAETGGCYDGLTHDGVNTNEGAESTLAYVLSVLELHHYRRACTAT